MSHNKELGFLREVADKFRETPCIRIIKRCVHFVEHEKWRRRDRDEREEHRKRYQALLPTREHIERSNPFRGNRNADLNTSFFLNAFLSVLSRFYFFLIIHLALCFNFSFGAFNFLQRKFPL